MGQGVLGVGTFRFPWSILAHIFLLNVGAVQIFEKTYSYKEGQESLSVLVGAGLKLVQYKAIYDHERVKELC